jgi:hypothetical protein
MTINKLRAAATAMLLSTVAVGFGGMETQAATVSARVGAALKEAQNLAMVGNHKAAMVKINEAEAALGKTPDDIRIINQMKQYVGVKSGDASIGGAPAAKAKVINDYNAGRYKEAIAGADTLRKYGAVDGDSVQIIAQSYYRLSDYKGCVRYMSANGSVRSENALKLLARCAYETGDELTQRQSLEALVVRSGKGEYWESLLKLAERSRGLSDHNTLDINRLRLMTGNIMAQDQYILLAQLALQLGNSAEAQFVIEKGIAAKVLSGERNTRLLTLAKTQAAAASDSLQKDIVNAQAQPMGDSLVKIGERMIGQGKVLEAIAVIKQGLKKSVMDPANGQTRLGQAILAAGQKSEAQKVFNGVTLPEKDAMISHLWSLFARSTSVQST